MYVTRAKKSLILVHRYFGDTQLRDQTVNAVLGYTPTVPHWAYNGNARRYWDFGYVKEHSVSPLIWLLTRSSVAGKTTNTERQIHHYGSGLNALVLLSAVYDDPSDLYLLRVAYGGSMGALSNINQHGFASCAMHAWPENLFWDAYSGDYGPNFLGLTLGSGTYLVQDKDLGIVVYGGVLQLVPDLAIVQVRDSVRQKIFVGPLGVRIRVDTGDTGRYRNHQEFHV